MADFNSITSAVRDATKARADKMIGTDPIKPVDASEYTPPGAMMNDIKTGMRPISRRQFRAGGKVSGEKATEHAGRKPRASGGNVGISYANRDMKAANEERPGIKHIGGMKRGGRAHKDMGGLALPAWADSVQRKSGGKVHADEAQDRKLIHDMGCQCAKCGGGRVGKSAGGVLDGGTRPKGGRIARAKGGRAKKGTNVNIIIATGGGQKPPMPMPPPGAMQPPPGPVGLHQGMPPPVAAAPMGPAAGGAPPMPMPRKRGGRAGYPIESGAGGGLGRLEKTDAYG